MRSSAGRLLDGIAEADRCLDYAIGRAVRRTSRGTGPPAYGQGGSLD